MPAHFPNLDALQGQLGYTFKNQALLQRALTHPSCTYQSKSKAEDNQRLEFLGDAVLQLVLTEHLYDRFAHLPEGQLTRMRANVVSSSSLARMAQSIELGRYLILGRGELASDGRNRASNLANAMEAVIGAIFEDSGWEAAKEFVLQLTASALKHVDALSFHDNPKGELQEMLQAQNRGTPYYELISEVGPDHDKDYTVAVMSGAGEIGRGQGKSKKLAEVQAALDALSRLP